MPPDDVKLELTRDWLVKVADDLQLAERALSLPPLPAGAMFHCQQAAEKALNAYLTWHDRSFRKTHNLEELRFQCADVDASFDELVSAATMLSLYATRFRYPGADARPQAGDAEAALIVARQVEAFVTLRLPPEASA